jgi:uracil phosphoribosyltransferase
MPSNIRHFTEVPACRLLADRTRRSDLDTRDYSEAYAELGRFLAYQVVQEFELEEYQIQHCEGPRPGVRIRDEERIGIVCLMRAGLYLAHGCRAVLRRSPLHLFSPERDKGLNPKELEELAGSRLETLILVDSVVNTGKTIRPIFAQAKAIGIKRVIVMAGVSRSPRALLLPKTTLMSYSTSGAFLTTPMSERAAQTPAIASSVRRLGHEDPYPSPIPQARHG